ncbi:MAG: hypothetical protein V7724_14725 [Sediminicola sp.]
MGKLGSYAVVIAGVLIVVSCSGSKRIKDISGEVLSIENGKDGYTASIKTEESTVYKALVSRPNLGADGNYGSMEVGNTVTVKGNVWEMEGVKQLTVREIVKVSPSLSSITGTVRSIENGTDGYTALLKTEKGETYKALFSIPNMGMNGNYRRVEVGEKVVLLGEIWNMGDEKNILVRILE